MEAIDLIKEQGLYRKVTEDYNPAIVIDLMEKYAVQKYHELTDGKVVVNGQNRSDKVALSLLVVSNNEERVAVCPKCKSKNTHSIMNNEYSCFYCGNKFKLAN